MVVAVLSQNQSFYDAFIEHPSEFEFNQNPNLQDCKDKFIICDLPSFLLIENDIAFLDKNHFYLVSGASDEENIMLVEKYSLLHLVGYNPDSFVSEIIHHLKKHQVNKMWGLNAYIEEQNSTQTISISESITADENVGRAILKFDFKDYFSSPVKYMQVMANELITNSLYSGPKSRRLKQDLEIVERKSPVFLKGSDLVQVTIGMDEHGVALSVQDSFGTLDYKTLISCLKRSFKEKKVLNTFSGTGLGLYLAYLHSNQFIINFRENFRTEVICIINKNKKYKDYKKMIHSFHFFQEVVSEKTRPAK